MGNHLGNHPFTKYKITISPPAILALVHAKMSAQLKIPCLGRPFNLGMLYDCQTDRLIPGKTLWDSAKLKSASQASAQPSSNFEVITEDTIQRKSSSLDLEGDLKLSFLSGLFEVNGAAKFINDKQSSEQQSRVTLKYSCTTRFEQLTMESLGSIQYPQVLDDQQATHMVIGVTYGSEAFFVFDRTVSKNENLKDIHGSMEAQISIIPISPTSELISQSHDATETEKFRCKFYGDILLPSNPSTFDDAVEAYRDLPKHLKLNFEAGDLSIPKVVYLSPLSALDGKSDQLVRSVSRSLISQVEGIMESFHHIEVICSDHKNHEICSKFLDIKNQISTFTMLVNRFKMSFVNDLSLLLPRIRGSKADEKELADLIYFIETSPFSSQLMEKYLKGKGREIKQLSQHLKNLERQSAIKFDFQSTSCDLEMMTTDDEIEYVVCFAFNVTSDTSNYIKNLETFLKAGKTNLAESKEWFEKADMSKCLRSKLKRFSDFVKVNSDSETSAFVVTDRNEETDASGPAVILYDNGVPVDFQPPGKPGALMADNVTNDSVSLTWTKPAVGCDEVTSYKVLYRSSGDPHYKVITNTPETSIRVISLTPSTEYHFQIQAVSGPGLSAESDPCTTKTKHHIRPADSIMKQSKLVANGSPAIYQLPMTLLHKNASDGLFKYKVCSKSFGSQRKPERVLMVVGATGAGKSTLINGMANYVFGVNWKDSFRFRLIDEGLKRSRAYSQTKTITAYKLDSKNMPYTLTIVDTPGFGDTDGIERDKYIARQIKQFFSGPGKSSIDVIHGIGFVTQASISRLTPTQKYIFDAVLSIFGKDIGDNIFLMCTFADANTPTVLDATKVANIPYKQSFKFNNSALFAANKSSESDFNSMFWEMGESSFKLFFHHFSRADAQSLELTKEVLKEREQLETLIPGLQEQVRVGLSQWEAIQQDEWALKQHEAEIMANEDFVYEVDEVKFKKIPLPDTVTTTCLTCSFTCHKSCAYSNDCDKRSCSSMGSNGNCNVCPRRCCWNLHANLPFHIEYYTERVCRTSEDLKKRYETAKTGKEQVESMITEAEEILGKVQCHVFSLIDDARLSIERLHEIALKPNPLTEIEYLDLLIESEKVEASPGWQSRVNQYMKVRRNAEVMKKVPKVSRNDIKSKSWWQIW